MSSIQSSRAKLAMLTRDLNVQWHRARNSWRDARSESFESEYLTDLLHSVDGAVAAMRELDALVGRIRSDCE